MKRPGRPPLPPEERRVDTHMRLRPDTLRLLDELAKLDGTSRTDVVEKAVWAAWEQRRHP